MFRCSSPSSAERSTRNVNPLYLTHKIVGKLDVAHFSGVVTAAENVAPSTIRLIVMQRQSSRARASGVVY